MNIDFRKGWEKVLLVLGALGIVGRALTEELLSRAYPLILADKGLHSAANYFKCDISQYRQIERIFLSNEIDYAYTRPVNRNWSRTF